MNKYAIIALCALGINVEAADLTDYYQLNLFPNWYERWLMRAEAPAPVQPVISAPAVELEVITPPSVETPNLPSLGSRVGDFIGSTAYTATYPVRFAYGKVVDLWDVTSRAGNDAGRFCLDHKYSLGAAGFTTVAALLWAYYKISEDTRVRTLKNLRDYWIVPLIEFLEDPTTPGNHEKLYRWRSLTNDQFDGVIRQIESNIGILGVRHASYWRHMPGLDMNRKSNLMRTFSNQLNNVRRMNPAALDRQAVDQLKITAIRVEELIVSSLEDVERERIRLAAAQLRQEQTIRERERVLEIALARAGTGHGGGSQIQNAQHQGAPIIVNIPQTGQPPAYSAWDQRRPAHEPRIVELEPRDPRAPEPSAPPAPVGWQPDASANN